MRLALLVAVALATGCVSVPKVEDAPRYYRTPDPDRPHVVCYAVPEWREVSCVNTAGGQK